MGNTLCGSVVVIAIPNAHTQDDATDSLSLRSFYGKNYVLQFCAIMRSWTLLAAFGGSYAPDYTHTHVHFIYDYLYIYIPITFPIAAIPSTCHG